MSEPVNLNELWKHHAKECARLALANYELEHPCPALIDAAAKHAALARCLYEHGAAVMEWPDCPNAYGIAPNDLGPVESRRWSLAT